jgi:hypothetical protein
MQEMEIPFPTVSHNARQDAPMKLFDSIVRGDDEIADELSKASSEEH